MFYLKKPPKRLIKVTIVVKRSNCAFGSNSRYQWLDRLNNRLFVDVFIVRSTVLSDDYHNELMEWKKEERKKGWTAFWDAFLQQKDSDPKASVIYTNKIQLGPDVNSIRYMSNNKLGGLDKFALVITYYCYVNHDWHNLSWWSAWPPNIRKEENEIMNEESLNLQFTNALSSWQNYKLKVPTV